MWEPLSPAASNHKTKLAARSAPPAFSSAVELQQGKETHLERENPMRVGGCTFAFGPKPLEDACRSLKELGFRIVDLGVCLGNTQVNPFDASENPEAVADTVSR